VDLLDCDVLLPAPYEIVDDAEPSTWPVDHSFTALTEHLKLSILVGRVLKTIYSPSGLKHANDAQLEGLLPDQLKFTGNDSNDMAGESGSSPAPGSVNLGDHWEARGKVATRRILLT
jgi:hypothetical protein